MANPLHEDNRRGWDITAAKYEHAEAEDIAFLRNGGVSQRPPEVEALAGLRNWCHCAIHLQCAAGLDTLSLLNLGAQRVIGVDISPRMNASARRKSDALSAAADWHCCDVLETPHELDGSADLVHTGQGALPWMSDLPAWAATVARLLKPGGMLHVFKGHPLDWVWDANAADIRLDPARGDYFAGAPGNADVWPAPFIHRAGADAPMHDFQHSLGAIVTAVIRAGLAIELLREYPEPFWNQFPNVPPDLLRRLPHTFTLVARKP